MQIAAPWSLNPGDQIERTTLHAQYGGRTQGGIGPSKLSANVFIFSDPIAGEKHGYFDGWQEDGCFHYTGEGQHGDQQMKSGNASILNHTYEGRALRLFQGARGRVGYVDEMTLDADQPWYTTDAPETGQGPVRTVIVFRLRPTTISPGQPSSKLAEIQGDTIEQVPIEQQWTERAFVDPSRELYEAERREARLVLALRDHLRAQGHDVYRLKILPEGERKPLFTDLYDATDNTLIEAKGTVDRGSIRMAVGQLVDYRRFLSSPILAILVPEQPRTDLLSLAHSQGIRFIWPSNVGYATSH
jgi:hypothetical protein